MSQKLIAYYRVSTNWQGQSGLGLDAQRTAVLNHITDDSELMDALHNQELSSNAIVKELNQRGFPTAFCNMLKTMCENE